MIVFILLVCHNKGFLQAQELPIITLQVDSMIRQQFHVLMTDWARDFNSSGKIDSFQLGSSYSSPFRGVNTSYMLFAEIADWCYIPLFGAAATSCFDSNLSAYSYSAGSGIIFKNRFFMLGLMGGLYNGKVEYDKMDLYFEETVGRVTKTTKSYYGAFPVFNTEDYPLLGFLKKIDGYLNYNEANAKNVEKNINNALNYMLRFTFKQFLGLSVFELYTEKGINDFQPGFDLSSYYIQVSGNKFKIANEENADIFNTVRYGLQIGGDYFVVVLELLTINSVFSDPSRNIQQDYQYYNILGLNAFPSVTFKLTSPDNKNTWFALRYNTLHAGSQWTIKNIPIPVIELVASQDMEAAGMSFFMILGKSCVGLSISLRGDLW